MSSPEKDFPASEMSSDPTGFSSAPSHYAQQARETIDRIHDLMSDEEFKMFCLGQVLKYTDRQAHKGQSAEDAAKAVWYSQMALHMEDRGPDPRWQREGFVPYQRQPAPPMQEMPFSMDHEPTVMPGFTAPVTDPWPPLSREQVVELHEALRDFTTDMTSARAPMSDEDQANTIWSAAVELHGTLERLGVGTPPTTRRWTEDELQQAVRAVQEPMMVSARLVDHEGNPVDPRRVERNTVVRVAITAIPVSAPSAGLVTSPLGGTMLVNVKTYPAVYKTAEDPRWNRIPKNAPMQHGPVDPVADYAQPSHLKPEHIEDWTAWARQGFPLDAPGEATRRRWYSQPGEVKHNCGTCRNCNLPYSMACAIAAEGTPTRWWRDAISMDALSEEMLLAQLTSTADNCPGWEQKP